VGGRCFRVADPEGIHEHLVVDGGAGEGGFSVGLRGAMPSRMRDETVPFASFMRRGVGRA